MHEYDTILEANDLSVSLSRIDLPVGEREGVRTFVFSLHSLRPVGQRERYVGIDPSPNEENAAGNLKVLILPPAGQAIDDQHIEDDIRAAKKLLAKKLCSVAKALTKED